MAEEKKSRVGRVVRRMTTRAKVTFISLLILILAGTGAYYLLYGKVEYVPLFSNISTKESGNIVAKLDEMNISNYKLENNGTTVLVASNLIDRVRVDLAMNGLVPDLGVGYEIFDEASFAITDEDRAIMYQRAMEGELARSIMTLEEVDYARVHLAMSEETLFSREVHQGNATVILDLNPLYEFQAQHVKGIIALVSSAVSNLPKENISVVDTNANLLSDNLYLGDEQQSNSQAALESLAIKQQFESQLESELQNMLEHTYGTGKIVVNIDAKLDLNSKEVTTIEYSDDGILKSQQDYFERNNSTGTANTGMSPVDNNIEYYSVDTDDAMNDSTITNFETVRNYEVGETRTYQIKAPGEVLSISTAIIYDGTLSATEVLSLQNIVSAAVGIDESRGDRISVEGIPFDRSYEENLIAEFDIVQQEFIDDQVTKKKFTFYGGIAGGGIFLILLIFLIIRLIGSLGKHEGDYYEEITPVPVADLAGLEPVKIRPFDDPSIEKSVKDYAEENPAKLADLVKSWMLKDEG
jgi:flagellar M-ring protein FliF